MRDTVGEIIDHIRDLIGVQVNRGSIGPKISLIVEDLGRNPSHVGDRIVNIAGEEISIVRTDGGFLVCKDVRFVEV